MKNYSTILSGHALRSLEEHTLHYDRRLTTNIVPPALRDYVGGVHSLHLKQVPSCQSIRRAGNRLSDEKAPFLKGGYFFDESTDGGGHGTSEPPLAHWSETDDTPPQFEEESDPPADLSASRNIYEDPFKILAGYMFASQYCEDKPLINVWPGGYHRIQDKLHPSYFGIDAKSSLRFVDVKGHREKMYFLFRHTHWGHKIQMERKSEKGTPLRYFANNLFRRLSHFIRGLPDPMWTLEEKARFGDFSEPRNKTFRAQRLLEVLKTVDGMFLQRYFAYPEEIWTWEKFDLYVIQAISILITDEFFDGEVSNYVLDEHVTHYEQLKRARKAFKLVIHEDEPEKYLQTLENQPRWIQEYFLPTWGKAVRHEGFSRLFLAGSLSQTRGSGTPPALVVLRSKRKFLTSVAELPPTVTQTQVNLFTHALEECVGEIPDHIFTGLSTKARVTVTGSACWESTRKEGGTAQAILELMSKYEEYQIPVRDLDTGEITSWKWKHQFESVGTAIFYACLDEVIESDLEDLQTVHLTVVKEPGKARVVTKGRAALKIILDTVSKICSHPLKKGFKSSESGMGRSHHGWNLFKDFSSEEMHNMLFTEDRERRVEDTFNDHIDRVQTWQDLWFCSTDYQEATDRMVHELAEITASTWMDKCGIPPLLSGIVMAVCFKPRRVVFSGTGPLSTIGVELSDGLRVITLRRGVLMGDPLTKVILHFSNIITRRLGRSLTDGTIFAHFDNGEECKEAYLTGLGMPLPE